MKVLVINSGSSSLKFRLYDMPAETLLARGLIERIGQSGSKLVLTYEAALPAEIAALPAADPTRQAWEAGKRQHSIEQDIANHGAALEIMLSLLTNPKQGILKSLKEIDAVGHRAVLGGQEISESVIVDENVIKVMEDYSDLVPLHNPPNIKGMQACLDNLPGVPNVAVFDTAFHQSLPEHAYIYPIPYKYYEQNRIRRYGFHGTSHRYVSMRAAELLGRPLSELALITVHMGNGSSIAAVKNGKSIDTSLGFSPTTGLPMGTRCGDIDCVILTYLQEKLGMEPEQLDKMVYKESGLLGICGYSDMRDVEEHALAGDKRAMLAMRILSYMTRKYIGSYVAAMNALDAVVFTAGIGENDHPLRAMILRNMEFLGIELDEEVNKRMIRGAEGFINSPQSRVKALVIPTNEELLIARDAVEVVEKNVRYVPKAKASISVGA